MADSRRKNVQYLIFFGYYEKKEPLNCQNIDSKRYFLSNVIICTHYAKCGMWIQSKRTYKVFLKKKNVELLQTRFELFAYLLPTEWISSWNVELSYHRPYSLYSVIILPTYLLKLKLYSWSKYLFKTYYS